MTRGCTKRTLEHLNDRYEEWFQRFDLCPVLTVVADDLDIVEEAAHRAQLTAQVCRALGMPMRGELQPGLPGIDRTAMVS